MHATSPQEIYQRTQAVLNYYQVPPEEDPESYIADLQNQQNFTNIQEILKYMDPHDMLSRLADLSATELDVFQDINAKQVFDMRANLTAKPISENDHIGDPSLRTKEFPLRGLRIALDPGHMGSHDWDLLTGKFVKDDQGHVVSEGVINLQTALLLEQAFKKLGAEVFVTRHELKPVSTLDYSTYDLLPYAQNEMRESIHTQWFMNLVAAHPIGPALFHAFDFNSTTRFIFSENERGNFFVQRIDLAARSNAMNDFHPDIALVIHYDADVQSVNSKVPYETKSYVAGAYQTYELASRADRAQFMRHLLDQKSWDLSLALSHAVVHKLHDELGLSLDTAPTNGQILQEPGVFSRNLGVSKRLKAPAMTYLECLYYNRPQDFKAIYNATHPMIIGGQNVPYSDRVAQVADAIRDGVLDFVSKH